VLTVAELREHLTSELTDDALERLLDAAYEAIGARIGTGDVSELLTAGPGDLLMLSRPASAIVSLTERGRELSDDDYELRPSGQMLVRRRTGPHPDPRWRGRIDVTYTPSAADADRDRVAIALVKLDLAHNPGLTGQALGAWSEQYGQGDESYAAARERILGSLMQSFLLF
jgi:hypothetical protein